jgi:hypothetical protein
MEIVSVSKFARSQTRYLKQVLAGEQVLLSSRLGMFKIEREALEDRIAEGLAEVKRIENGEAEGLSLDDVLNDL